MGTRADHRIVERDDSEPTHPDATVVFVCACGHSVIGFGPDRAVVAEYLHQAHVYEAWERSFRTGGLGNKVMERPEEPDLSERQAPIYYEEWRWFVEDLLSEQPAVTTGELTRLAQEFGLPPTWARGLGNRPEPKRREPRPNTTSKEREAEVVALLQLGHGIKSVRRQLAIGHETVVRIRDENGIPPTPTGRPRGKTRQ